MYDSHGSKRTTLLTGCLSIWLFLHYLPITFFCLLLALLLSLWPLYGFFLALSISRFPQRIFPWTLRRALHINGKGSDSNQILFLFSLVVVQSKFHSVNSNIWKQQGKCKASWQSWQFWIQLCTYIHYSQIFSRHSFLLIIHNSV